MELMKDGVSNHFFPELRRAEDQSEGHNTRVHARSKTVVMEPVYFQSTPSNQRAYDYHNHSVFIDIITIVEQKHYNI